MLSAVLYILPAPANHKKSPAGVELNRQGNSQKKGMSLFSIIKDIKFFRRVNIKKETPPKSGGALRCGSLNRLFHFSDLATDPQKVQGVVYLAGALKIPEVLERSRLHPNAPKKLQAN